MNRSILAALSLFHKNISFRSFATVNADENILEPFAKFSPFLARAREIVAECESQQIKIIYPGHDLYPSGMLSLAEPPLFLTLEGEAAWCDSSPLAIVGSREPSRRAVKWLDAVMLDFLRLVPDVCIVSGGARGIDQRAHAASIRSQRPTVAFLPSGILNPYPAEINEWKKSILDNGGGLLSMVAPRQEIRRGFFEQRNEAIAAMSVGVVVIEAKRRSGTTMTARLARELGREVAAVPSFPSDVGNAGGLDLLSNGAHFIRDAQDLAVFLMRNRVRSIPSSPQAPECRA